MTADWRKGHTGELGRVVVAVTAHTRLLEAELGWGKKARKPAQFEHRQLGAPVSTSC